MSYPQFTYTAASLSSQPQLLISASQTSTTNTQPCCCEGGRLTDPHTGRQTVCSCQYGPPNLLSLSRVPALSDSVYNSAAAAAYAAQGYMGAFGSDPSAFYPLNSAYDLKESPDSWRGLAQPTACYPYDAAAMAAYPYGNSYGGVDLNGGIRRKNATRETTSTLKAWLYEHRKNPYPTKGEKIMLAIITKMTLTQVSTWFANARRRLKKENKMTWSPRNRSGDDSDKSGDEGSDKEDDDRDGTSTQQSTDCTQKACDENSTDTQGSVLASPTDTLKDVSLAPPGVDTNDPSKPRIWSLAHVATSNSSPPQTKRSPPPPALVPSQQHPSPTQSSPSHQWPYRNTTTAGYHPYRVSSSQGQSTSTQQRNDYTANYMLHRETSAISTPPTANDQLGADLLGSGPNDSRLNTAFRPLNNNSFIHEKIPV